MLNVVLERVGWGYDVRGGDGMSGNDSMARGLIINLMMIIITVAVTVNLITNIDERVELFKNGLMMQNVSARMQLRLLTS